MFCEIDLESIKKSFDGGFSENLYFDDDFENLSNPLLSWCLILCKNSYVIGMDFVCYALINYI